MSEGINYLRHLEVFSPAQFAKRRIDIIGCGATGSKIALSLAKLGVENLHLWDFDKVEPHNLPNQDFALEHIGQFKVDAIKSIIKAATGSEPIAHNKRVADKVALGEVVFLLTDTMASRKEIWDKSIKMNFVTRLMVETRMGKDNGRVYAVNPNAPDVATKWEGTLYNDEKTEVSACGGTTTVGPTADMISGLAVWQFIRWFNIISGKGEENLEFELIFGINPLSFLINQ